ncbi:VanZ family protein, partial [Streptomyces sp. NPDC002156]
MDSNASLPVPPRRTRRIVLLGLAVLGLAGAAYVVQGPLMMAAPRCMAGRWHGCYDTFNGVVLMTVVLLPLAVLVAWALAYRRRAAGVASAWRLSLAEVGMVHGTLPFVWMTLMPGSEPGTAPARVSLVPLRDLVTMGPLGIAGNLLVFASLGFFAPMR